jgi:hypothetical protein
MADSTALKCSAIAATLAQRGITTLKVYAPGHQRELLARETDLPAELINMLHNGGTIEGGGVVLCARNGSVHIQEAPHGFTDELNKALETLRAAADRSA